MMTGTGFCTRCGAARAGGDRFCGGCGAPLPQFPAPAEVIPTVPPPTSSPWSARFVLQAAREAIATVSLSDGTDPGPVVRRRPLIRVTIRGLESDDFQAAFEHSKRAGCRGYLDGPGCRFDYSMGSLYMADSHDRTKELALEGIGAGSVGAGGGENHVLRALDISIAILDELVTPLKGDRVSIALHVMSADYEPVVAALERTTGQPRGRGWALRACFAGARADGDHGAAIGSSIEVD